MVRPLQLFCLLLLAGTPVHSRQSKRAARAKGARSAASPASFAVAAATRPRELAAEAGQLFRDSRWDDAVARYEAVREELERRLAAGAAPDASRQLPTVLFSVANVYGAMGRQAQARETLIALSGLPDGPVVLAAENLLRAGNVLQQRLDGSAESEP